MSVLKVDEKYRVVLDKDVREVAGLEKGDELLAIPFRGGVILASLKGKRFVGSLSGFHYDEAAHEASKYLFRGK